MRSEKTSFEPQQQLEQSERTKHTQRWNELDGKYYKLGVENGIRDVVVGLNLLGLSTRGSCEGHYHHPQNRLYENPDGTLYQQWAHPYVSLTLRAEQIATHPGAPALQQLINEFYENRATEPQYKIALAPFQLSAGGRNTVDIPRNKDQFRRGNMATIEWLGSQRREMFEFGSFLKQKYLETGFQELQE